MDDHPSSSPSLLTIACRFIPHDQWLVTHVDPSWKTKQVKLWILSKCFSSSGPSISPPRPRRPPSPITFAPDPRHRPISPITFAPTSEQHPNIFTSDLSDPDSDWENQLDSDEGLNNTLELRPRPRTNLYSPRTPQPPSLEPLSSSPVFSHNPTLSNPPQSLKRTPSKRRVSDSNVGDLYTLIRFSTGQALEDDFNFSWYNLRPFELLEMHRAGVIMALPREITLYVQPYFEAKVMALRVVWQRSHRNSIDHAAKRKTRLEWRERWVIINAGMFNLCRARKDSVPSHHIPLSHLIALRGSAQLEKTLTVTDEQRIICAKFRLDAVKASKSTAPLVETDPKRPAPLAPANGHASSSYAYAFSGSSARKAKSKSKVKKQDTFSSIDTLDGRSASVTPMTRSAGSIAAVSSLPEPKTLTKHSSGASLRLPKLNTASSASRAKLIRTSTTLRKAQESLRTSNKPGPSRAKIDNDPEATPPTTVTPPEPSPAQFDLDDIHKILTIGRELGEEPPQDDDDNFSNLSSPVFAAPPSPLYAPPSSLLYNFNLDDDDDFGEDEERGNEADGEGDGDIPASAPDVEKQKKLSPRIENDFKRKGEDKGEEHEERSSDGGEWVVLDMMNDDAYHSILRILHRHFPHPVSSSFVNTQPVAPLDTPVHTPTSSLRDHHSSVWDAQQTSEGKPWDDSASRISSILTISSSLPNSPISTSNTSHIPGQPRRARSQSPPRNSDSLSSLNFNSSTYKVDSFHKFHSRSGAARLAPLPYPEWRVDLVGRARSAGLGYVSKAMELLHKQSERPYMARSHRPHRKNSRRSSNVGRHRKSSGKKRKAFIAEDDCHQHGHTENAEESGEDRGRRGKHGVVGSGEGDVEDDEDSAFESSEIEWRGWMRDLTRQSAVQRLQQRKSLQIDPNLSSSGASLADGFGDSPVDANHTHISNSNPHRNQQSRIALEPSGVVVSVPQTTGEPTPTRVVTSDARPSPNWPPSSTVSSPSSADSIANRYRSPRTALAANFSPVEELSSATSTSSPPANINHEQYLKATNGNLHSHSQSLVYGTWKSDMGVRLRVQEPYQRKRDIGPQVLLKSVMSPTPNTGRLAFRGIAAFPSNQPSLSPAVSPSRDLSPPTVKVSPPSVINLHNGNGLSNKLPNTTGLSRRSSSAGADVKRKGSISGGRNLPMGNRNDDDQDLQTPRPAWVSKGKERARDNDNPSLERHTKDCEQTIEIGHDSLVSGKRQRPKLSLATPGSAPFSAPPSTIHKPPSRPQSPTIPSSSTRTLLRHVRSKSREMIVTQSPKIDIEHSSNHNHGVPPLPTTKQPPSQGSSDKSIGKKKGFVAFNAEKFLTGFDSALDFVDGR